MRLALQPFGNVPIEVIETLATDLSIFNADIDRPGTLGIPDDAYEPRRMQYHADSFMGACSEIEGDKVLGIAAVDLFAQSLNFVFGQAEIGGRTAVISIARLADQDRAKFRERVTKEAVHELGHTFGLKHCSNSKCVMFFSNSLADTDRKGKEYCSSCAGQIPSAWRPRRR